MFEHCSCEEAGISSKKVLSFLKYLEKRGFPVHSLLMAKGRKIFLEANYKPFDSFENHRMYSVSKSFVSIAVGLAVTEGLMSLDDRIIDYFPEYRNESTDALYDATTVRDMLTMRSNVASFAPWWKIFDDRVKAYYSQKSAKVPGSVFYYDSMGSYLLGCIVEKLTGKTFLDYLKDKILLKMGFSQESYTLYAPGKYTLGDSGVMCSPRDLLIFARFIMDGGVFDGVRYIDEEFMKAAVSKQSDCDTAAECSIYKPCGYGYLIWKMPYDGFALVGMGNQLAVCDVSHDFIFVLTADCQGCGEVSRELILDHFYSDIIENISEFSIETDLVAEKTLEDYVRNLKLVCQRGESSSLFTHMINGKKFLLQQNSLNLQYIKLSFDEDTGIFEYQDCDGVKIIRFGLCHNVAGRFPVKERNSLIAGEMCSGDYSCAASGAFTNTNEFALKIQITDTYLGCLNLRFAYVDDSVTLSVKKSGQYILDGYDGYFIGYMEKEN